MNDIRLTPDDPRLTAYALGELQGDARAAVESALRRNPALQRVVDEIRATAAQLEAALAAEAAPQPSRSFAPRTEIFIPVNGHARSAAASSPHGPPRSARQRNADRDAYATARRGFKLLQFPQLYYVVAGAAAACFAAFVSLRETAPVSTWKPAEPNSAPAPAVAQAGAAMHKEAPGTDARGSAVSPQIVADAEAPGRGEAPARSGAAAPAFIEGDLSLISQAARQRLDPVAPSASDVDLAPKFASTPNGEPPPAPAESRSDSIQTMVTQVNPGPIAPLLADALRPPVAGPVVAAATSPSVLPEGGASGVSSVIGAGPGDVVLMSAVTVRGDRVQGFAVGSSSRRAGTNKRRTALNDDRPYPPPGARFVRRQEATAGSADNPFVSAVQTPRSTLSFEVDTGSYSHVRQKVEEGSLPLRERVRIEEMLNFFPYSHASPIDDDPFAATLEIAGAPWAPEHRLVRIAVKARDAAPVARGPANLVFLLDISGSMNEPNKLPLLKEAVRSLLRQLTPDDRLAIVVYGSDAGLALPSTPVARSRDILNALEALAPFERGGGATGIQLAYEVAQAGFDARGANRVIVCTDGDFKVGLASESELLRFVEDRSSTGVSLSVLGFGMGNHRDPTLESMAIKGKGNFGYIDTRRGAEVFLLEQAGGAFVTVAKDVKLEVDFNSAAIASYRLIGYENPWLREEDFNLDLPDAGEVGAGQTLTALYEIVPAAGVSTGQSGMSGDALVTVRLRYRKPDAIFSFPKTLEFPLRGFGTTFAQASADFRFAAAVAQYGMILRDSPYGGGATFGDVAGWAAAAITPRNDPEGFRREFLDLVYRTQALME